MPCNKKLSLSCLLLFLLCATITGLHAEKNNTTEREESKNNTTEPENKNNTTEPENKNNTTEPENKNNTTEPENKNNTTEPEDKNNTTEPEENKNNTTESENKNNTVPLNDTMSPLTTATPDYKDNPSSVAQPRKITQSQKTTRERIPFITEDIDYDSYEDDEDDSYKEHLTLPPRVSYEACPFNRCKHLELPCSEIQKSTGGKCLCPGISGPAIRPDAPQLKGVTPGQTGISVTWCSPLSTVQGYRVLYGAPEGPLEKGPLLNQSHRFFSIPNLVPGMAYRVCVVAINDAGESQVEQSDEEEGWPGQGGFAGPCGTYVTYDPHGSYLYLAVGIGLAIFAGLLGIFVLVYWLKCRKRNRKIKRAVGEEMGVTNMSFRAESVENL